MSVSRFNRYGIPALIACAALISWFATVRGAGFTPDSVVYLRAARALADGQSIFQIGTHFPPGYSLLWAGVMLLTGDDFLAARVIGVSSQVLMLAGVAAVLARSIASNFLQGFTVAVLVVSTTYASIFWMAWSEASFLAAMIWGIYFALEIRVGGGRIFHVLMFLLCLISMLLLRYASLPLVGGLLLYLLFCQGRPGIAVIGRSIAAGLIIVAPVAIWLSISTLEAEQSVARQLAFHPPGETHWQQLLATVTSWGGGILPLLWLGVLVCLWLGAPFNTRARNSVLGSCSLVLIYCYTAFLGLSITFFDAHTPLDARILSPLLPLSLCLACSLLPDKPGRMVSLAMLAWLLLLVPDLTRAWSDSMQNGMGYNTRGLSELEVLDLADELPADAPIYTNIGEIYYLYRDRETQTLPRIYDPLTRIANQSVAAQWEAALMAMREHGGVVVWSPLSRYRTYLPTVEDMLVFGDLVVSEERGGGVVMRPRDQPPVDIRPQTGLVTEPD